MHICIGYLWALNIWIQYSPTSIKRPPIKWPLPIKLQLSKVLIYLFILYNSTSIKQTFQSPKGGHLREVKLYHNYAF